MSDREKGIPRALNKVFPKADQAYCCQHITDNIQARYGIKCVPLFQRCTRAKTKARFKDVLATLTKQNLDVGDYV